MKFAVKLRQIWIDLVRRFRLDPSYFFLLYRWGAWLYAVDLIIIQNQQTSAPGQILYAPALLVITFLQSAYATIYRPIIYGLIRDSSRAALRPRRMFARYLVQGPRLAYRAPFVQIQKIAENIRIKPLSPRVATRNTEILSIILDVLVSGLVVYLSGGWLSPFYRYGLASILTPAYLYGFAGGVAAALAYSAFMTAAGILVFPGLHFSSRPTIDIIRNAIVDGWFDPLAISLILAYLSYLIRRLKDNKVLVQRTVRELRAISRVNDVLINNSADLKSMITASAEAIRKAGRFDVVRLVVSAEDGALTQSESFSDNNRDISIEMLPPGENMPASGFERGEEVTGVGKAWMYYPLNIEVNKQAGYLYVESMRSQPFQTETTELLEVLSNQLTVTIENILLHEQKAKTAAEDERNRIARDIHDGIAQSAYILSLSLDTCLELAQRGNNTAALSNRLEHLSKLSKQILWETRHYLFNLKPFIAGSGSLEVSLKDQCKEFQTITGLPVELTTHKRKSSTDVPVPIATTVLRITQEALSNTYQHARASQVKVNLEIGTEKITLQISDDGTGFEPQIWIGDENTYPAHLGIKGMYSRVTEAGGNISIESTTHQGVCIAVTLPLQENK